MNYQVTVVTNGIKCKHRYYGCQLIMHLNFYLIMFLNYVISCMVLTLIK